MQALHDAPAGLWSCRAVAMVHYGGGAAAAAAVPSVMQSQRIAAPAHLSSGGTSLSAAVLLGLLAALSPGGCAAAAALPEPGPWEAWSDPRGDMKVGAPSVNSTSEPTDENADVRLRCRPAQRCRWSSLMTCRSLAMCLATRVQMPVMALQLCQPVCSKATSKGWVCHLGVSARRKGSPEVAWGLPAMLDAGE